MKTVFKFENILIVSTHISDKTYDNKAMVQIIMNQKSSLEKLMGLMELVSNKAVLEVSEQLKPIFAVYSSIEAGAISESQLKVITQVIASVRDEMIN